MIPQNKLLDMGISYAKTLTNQDYSPVKSDPEIARKLCELAALCLQQDEEENTFIHNFSNFFNRFTHKYEVHHTDEIDRKLNEIASLVKKEPVQKREEQKGISNTVRDYHRNIKILQKVVEHLRNTVNLGPKEQLFLASCSMELEGIHPPADYTADLLESDMKKNISHTKNLVKFAHNADLVALMTKLQNGLTEEECEEIKKQLEPDVVESEELKEISLVNTVQIPLQYPSLQESDSLNSMSQNIINEVKKYVEAHAGAREKQIYNILLDNDPERANFCLKEEGLRNDQGQIVLEQITPKFAECSTVDPLFLLYCKSLRTIDLEKIIASKDISGDLKNKITSGLVPYHASLTPVRVMAEIYKMTKLGGIIKTRNDYENLKREGKLTFKEWDPAKGYRDRIAIAQDIPISSSSVLPNKEGMELYNDMLGQLSRDVLNARGNNIRVSYNKGSEIINKQVFDFFKEMKGLKAMGDEMISDSDLGKYAHILQFKPEDVDSKEYIVAHMLYLASQTSQNQLSITATNHGFIPKYSKNAQDTDSLVDFDAAKVGLAQTCNGVLLNKLDTKASFIVKLTFDCTKENCNTPAASLVVFDWGPFTAEQFQKAFQTY